MSKKSNSGSLADDLQSQFKLQDFPEGEECQGKIQKLENEIKVPETLEKRKMGKEVFAIDCEMVGVGPPGSGSRGGERRKDTLARVSIVNIQEMCVLDEYVKPSEEVTNFCTDRYNQTCTAQRARMSQFGKLPDWFGQKLFKNAKITSKISNLWRFL